ncbi:xanthine dehydrogenase small subunit [Anaeromyxobacter diazotrophicus]|uniref:Xanthine dehydrogenase small subunit n=1 Tax=Anaeromyxobacter diazotrophicus TaxID=2590199 RepID=A0A7I9VR65_9BACT|nr:xanthine dehydrogenase small subunit [Anaeromyxobacter diazotrophicus]GEJ58914.1 xanthine dehydrogenase small subunit [Anaeromyxobacter diazotrophicus]
MSDRIRFVLDGKVRELAGVDPTLTVLRWLREVEHRTGTKEGCAEGDCGACTVVLADLRAGEVRYRAVNACLLFLPALDGKALLTVEDARGADGGLHPVQEAMVACHASQCGFCTPGFVMSLVALYESEPAPSRRRLDDVLAGNLCRCTGYRPIVAAARQAYASGERSALAAQQAQLAALLASVRREGTLALEHGGRRFFAPRTLAALAEILERHPGARLVAGGTDAGLWVTKQHRTLETLVSLASVEELLRVTVTDTHLELGAAVTYADAHAVLAAHHPDLGELVRRIGSQQIRNMGTLAGNVANASPIGDTLPALLALDATLVLQRGGARRELPLDGFFTGYRQTALRPGELIAAIRLPARSPDRAFRAYKVSKRFDQDISAVCGAFAVTLAGDRVRDVRLCYGGAAATPLRARAAERALLGRPWDEAAVAAALPVLDGELAPISDARATAGYRRLVAKNLLRKFQLETAPGRAAPPAGTRVLAAPEEA